MVLTASFPLPPGYRSCTRRRSQPLRGGPGPGKPGTKPVKPPAHAQCGSAGLRCGCSGSQDWAPVLNHGARRCGGGGGGGGAASRASGGPGRFHFLRSPARARVSRGSHPAPRPARGSPPGRAARGSRGRARPSRWRPRRVLRAHARPPASPPSSWCGPWRAHHGD